MIAWIAAAAAQSWTSVLIEPNTATTEPVGVSVRQWTATDQVFFAIETRESAGDMEHLIQVEEWTCSNPSCTAVSLTDGPDVLDNVIRGDQYMNASMGIQRETSTAPIKLQMAMRGLYHLDCDGDGIDYAAEPLNDKNVTGLTMRRWIWDTAVGEYAYPPVLLFPPVNTVCEDAGLSYTRIQTATQEPHTVFRWNTNPGPGGALDRLEYAVNTTSTTVPNTNPGGSTVEQEHAQFDFYDEGEKRVVAHRSYEQTAPGVVQWVIRVQFLDESPAPDVRFFGTHDADYPSIVYHDERFHLVWNEQNNARTDGKIWYATCDRTSTDCFLAGNWDVELVDAGSDMQHANVEVDGNRVFIVYMDDLDPTFGDMDYRVRVKTQCFGAAAWSTVSEATPRSPANAEWTQSIYMGRPNFALNRVDNLFHLGLIEAQSYLPTANDREAYWVRASYSDCP